MKTDTTLFQLKTDRTDVFDGSTLGVSILAARNAERTAQGGLRFDGGVVELARRRQRAGTARPRDRGPRLGHPERQRPGARF